MGKIVSNFFMSLDGVVEAPDQWHFPYFNDEMGAVIGQGMETSGAFLMGRKLYQEWEEYWPQQSDDVPFSSFINNVRKYVLSNTLTDATWNNTTLISGSPEEVAKQLADAKAAVDGDIAMSGSATTAGWLLANGLLDELALLVHPIVVGHGQRLFDADETQGLELVQHETLSTGVLHLRYAPAPIPDNA